MRSEYGSSTRIGNRGIEAVDLVRVVADGELRAGAEAVGRSRCRHAAEATRRYRAAMTSRVVAIDIGGTKLSTGVVAVDGTLLQRCDAPTPPGTDPDALFATLARLLDAPRHRRLHRGRRRLRRADDARAARRCRR